MPDQPVPMTATPQESGRAQGRAGGTECNVDGPADAFYQCNADATGALALSRREF
jgi:hypothetical protein